MDGTTNFLHGLPVYSVSIALEEKNETQSEMNQHYDELHNMSYEPEVLMEATERASGMLDAKYEKADIPAEVEQNSHLSEGEKKALRDLLFRFEHLFDGTLGDWQTDPVNLELKTDAKPYHAKAFPVPHIYEQSLKTEVQRLCDLGVIEKINESEWAAPTFIIPKKNGTPRFVSDFRVLNSHLKRKPFPIPPIQDLLQKLDGFTHATSLDLNMGYYTIKLTPGASNLCTIVLPWGKYCYKRLPMGVAGSPDIFQEKMTSLMAGLEFVRTYLDDLLIITKESFEDHFKKLEVAFE